MGLGKLFERNITYDVTNSQTGAKASYTLITDGGPGMYPGWGAGEYQGGMAIPAAWRASLLIANQLGRVPFQAFREVAGRPPVRIVPTPTLLARPAGSLDTSLGAFRSWGLDRVWHGNAIGVVAEWSPLGWPTAATPVSAEFVQMKLVQPNDPVVAPGFQVGEIAYLINGRWYHQRDVIHFKGPSKPGELRGMGILEAHFDMLDRARKLDASASAVDSGAVPTGVLKSLDPDLSATGAASLKAAWQASQRTRSVAVLNPLTDFQPIAWNPTETQLIEARKYTLIEWGNVFGIDPSFIGGESAAGVYSNSESKGFDLLKFGTVGDIIAEFEQTLTEKLPRGNYVKANLDHLLRNETKARYEAHAIALSSRILTVDEVRALEELPPLTEEQMAQMKKIAEIDAPPAPPANNTQGAGAAKPRPSTSGQERALAWDRLELEVWTRDTERRAWEAEVCRTAYLIGLDPEALAYVADRMALETAQGAAEDGRRALEIVQGWEERGYPEFNQHQPRWPRGTGDHAGEWTDTPGGRAPYGAKNPSVGKKTNTIGKWKNLQGGGVGTATVTDPALKKVAELMAEAPPKISYVKPKKATPKPGTPEYKAKIAELMADAFGDDDPVVTPPPKPIAGGNAKLAGALTPPKPPWGGGEGYADAKPEDQAKNTQDFDDFLAEVSAGPDPTAPKNVSDVVDIAMAKGVPPPQGSKLKGALANWTPEQWGTYWTTMEAGGKNSVEGTAIAEASGAAAHGTAGLSAIAQAKVKILQAGFKEGHLDGKLKPYNYTQAEAIADALGTDPPWKEKSKNWTAAQWGAYWTEVAKDPDDPGYAMDEAIKVGEKKKLAKTAAEMSEKEKEDFIAAAFAELNGGGPPSGFGQGPKVGDSPPLGQGKVQLSTTPYGDPKSFANQLAARYAKEVGGVPESQRQAAARYFASGYTPMNKHLWGVSTLPSGHPHLENIRQLTEMMKAWEAPQTLRLARGLNADPNMPPYPAPKGTVYASKGFQSTTVGDTPAFSHLGVIMNITLPKGSNGVVANGTGVAPFNNEEELLLPHGTRYLIEEDKIGPDGKRYMNVTVLPWEG